MMLLYARVPHSRVMYNEMELKAANSSLLMKRYSDIANRQDVWMLIDPYDITYPCRVSVGRQRQLKRISFKVIFL